MVIPLFSVLHRYMNFYFQIITSVPTRHLPKHICSWGKGEPEEEAHEDELDGTQPVQDGVGRRGQILWVRGLTRLQQQVSAPKFLSYYRNE